LSPDIEWFCVLNEIRPGDQGAFEQSGAVRFLGDQLQDFADTAALIDRMDLMISVDTSIAHLAGALGKPIWVLLPFAADWRWMSERTDSPWYASARLVRQARPDDWDGVLQEVRQALLHRSW
jgi:ADP-heptose:LPS heptosyltransferase